MKNLLLASLIAIALQALPVYAQKYPSRPIRIVVPYTPGGPTDILARAVGQSMNEAWGQPVIIDNKPGNSGNLGTAQVAKSPADGYTLASVGISYSVAPALDAKLGYDPVKDLTPIALMASGEVRFLVDLDASTQWRARKALLRAPGVDEREPAHSSHA